MNKLLFIVCVVMLLACGNKKEFAKVDSVESVKSTEQLYAELYRTTRLLELLDIRVRQVETRDSAGNVRIVTDTEISKKIDRKDWDTTKVVVNKQGEEEKVVNVETNEERSRGMRHWVWIVRFIIVIVVVLIMRNYIYKRSDN